MAIGAFGFAYSGDRPRAHGTAGVGVFVLAAAMLALAIETAFASKSALDFRRARASQTWLIDGDGISVECDGMLIRVGWDSLLRAERTRSAWILRFKAFQARMPAAEFSPEEDAVRAAWIDRVTGGPMDRELLSLETEK